MVSASASTVRTGDAKDRSTFVTYRSIVSFATGNLPAGAQVTAASLTMTRQSLLGSVTNLGALRVDVRTGAFGSSPSLEAADYSAGASGTLSQSLAIPTANNQNRSVSFTGATELNLINTTGVTQCRLQFPIENDGDKIADQMFWHAGEALIQTYRPKLAVTYSAP